VAKRRGCLGCSFPVLIIIAVVIIGLVVVSFLSGAIGSAMFGIEFPKWLIVDSPHVSLPAHTLFHIGSFPISNAVFTTWVTMAVLILLFGLVARHSKLVPGRMQGIIEGILGWLLDFCVSVAGEQNGRRFFPLIATIFLFVLFNGWLGLVPGYGTILYGHGEHMVHILRPANTDINTPLALAFVSFAATLVVGFGTLKIRFLKQYLPLHLWLDAHKKLFKGNIGGYFGGIANYAISQFVGILEFLSLFIRVISFTFRLFGNMTAGEILLLVVMFLMPYVAAVIFYGLELLVGVIQALIFGGLTLIFLTMAAIDHDEAH
jgi:F-type H+-transporting ATPase subunit a